MEYLIILIILLLISIFLEWKYRIHLYQSKKERLWIPIIFFIIGVLWDSWAVYRGHWNFEGQGLIGIKIGYLPLEEYLFFLIFPYFLLTTYRFFKKEIYSPPASYIAQLTYPRQPLSQIFVPLCYDKLHISLTL